MVALQFLVLSVVVRVRLGQRGAASEVIRSPFLYAFGKSNLLSFMSLFYLYSIRNGRKKEPISSFHSNYIYFL